MSFALAILTSITYWGLVLLLTTYPSAWTVWLSLLCCVAIVGSLMIAGKRFIELWHLWAGFLLFVPSVAGVTMVFSTATARNSVFIVGGLLVGSFIFIVRRYLLTPIPTVARVYLEFVSYVFLIGYWCLSVLVSFSQISYNLSTTLTIVILTISSILYGRGIILTNGLIKSSERLVLVTLAITTAQLVWVLTLLPIHYYASAAVLTMWLFFMSEVVILGQHISSRRSVFRTYLTMTAIMIALVVGSSLVY